MVNLTLKIPWLKFKLWDRGEGGGGIGGGWLRDWGFGYVGAREWGGECALGVGREWGEGVGLKLGAEWVFTLGHVGATTFDNNGNAV